jgi:hypothetical protein
MLVNVTRPAVDLAGLYRPYRRSQNNICCSTEVEEGVDLFLGGLEKDVVEITEPGIVDWVRVVGGSRAERTRVTFAGRGDGSHCKVFATSI